MKKITLFLILVSVAGLSFQTEDLSKQLAASEKTSVKSIAGSHRVELTLQSILPPYYVPYTVLDYYLLLPHEYVFGYTGLTLRGRIEIIKTQDIQHGYLVIQSQLSEEEKKFNRENGIEDIGIPKLEIALFKRPNGPDVIALSYEHYDGSPLIYEPGFLLLEFSNNYWYDITHEIVSQIKPELVYQQYKKNRRLDELNNYDSEQVMNHLYYVLPRYGTTIEAIVDPQWTRHKIKLFDLKWKDGKFEAVF